MSNLYELTRNYAELTERIAEGTIPEEAIKDTMEAVSGEWSDKVEAIVSVIRTEEALIKGIEEQKKILDERKSSKKKSVEYLKAYLSSNMQLLNQAKYESSACLITFRKSQTVEISDKDTYCKWALKEHPETVKTKIEYSPDKEIIKKLLKNGEELDGVTLEEHKNIQIK